jgi:membrane protease YdiL (CAAX protease family)
MNTDLQNQVRALLRVTFISFTSFAFGLGMVLLTITLLSNIGIPIEDRPALSIGLNVILMQGLAFGTFAALYMHSRNEFELIQIEIPSLKDWITAASGVIILYVLFFSFILIVQVLGLPFSSHSIAERGSKTPIIFLLLIPLSFLIIAPGEELLYRAIIQGSLRRHFSAPAAIGVTSIFFALIHIFSFSGEGRIVTLGLVLILSLVIGTSYEYSANLSVPTLIHGTYNAFQFLLLYLRTATI